MFRSVTLNITVLRSVVNPSISIFQKKPMGKMHGKFTSRIRSPCPLLRAIACMICEIIFGNGMMQSFFTKNIYI